MQSAHLLLLLLWLWWWWFMSASSVPGLPLGQRRALPSPSSLAVRTTPTTPTHTMRYDLYVVDLYVTPAMQCDEHGKACLWSAITAPVLIADRDPLPRPVHPASQHHGRARAHLRLVLLSWPRRRWLCWQRSRWW